VTVQGALRPYQHNHPGHRGTQLQEGAVQGGHSSEWETKPRGTQPLHCTAKILVNAPKWLLIWQKYPTLLSCTAGGNQKIVLNVARAFLGNNHSTE